MKTFVAEDVLRDYTAGMVVVKAESFEKAVELIKDSDWFISDCHGEVLANLRELKDNEICVVKGGQ